MLRIGLSGGIGAGKSTVSDRLREHGALIIDADSIARDVVAPGTVGLSQIEARFGDQILTQDGALDRAALGRIVFADKEARADLESITHPRIYEETVRRMASAGEDQIVVHDIPLLVELHRETDYQLTIIVMTDEHARHERLVRDRGMDPQEAWGRIRAQADDDQRRAAADVLLPNEGSQAELLAQVDALWDNRIVPYDDNVRSDRGVRRPSGVTIADYDPQWPVIADRLCRRIAAQLERADFGHLQVDHIGSTSVPGLAAKDVIDLQLQVPDLSVAQQDSFAGALRSAGFTELRPHADHPQPWAPDPGQWTKLFANGADPARLTHLHVRPAGGPAAQVALQFRDWLRANPTERTAYEAVKRAVAQQHPGGTAETKQDYVEAKEPWFAANLPRARQWALQADTGS